MFAPDLTVLPALAPPAAWLLAVDTGVPGPLGNLLSHEYLRFVLQVAIFLANLAGGIVVLVAIIRGFVTYVVDLVRARGGPVPKESIRLTLGRSLSLALEFQLGADILGTALDPTQADLIILAVIIVLRTVLNYFLGKEIEGAQRREQQAGGVERESARARERRA